MDYYKTDEKDIEGLDVDEIEELYGEGYVLTRLGKMQQTRSLRVDLDQFEENSENRRILRRSEDIEMIALPLPLPENETNWRIHSLGKTFYSEKFDDVKFSANKIREMILTDKLRFNTLLAYYKNNALPNTLPAETIDHTNTLGYAICFKTESLLHYSFPFYDLKYDGSASLGMSMMLKAILWAKKQGLKYIYLGSYTRPADRYKLQFKGLEWWNPQSTETSETSEEDGQSWDTDLDKLKRLV
ncbi:hypothetical protein GF389_01505 [Candidatus Dojkabacteria bacterium]|nr:hypothetical protein [Candidatus Dojkabacteria bacterium]